MSFKIFSLQLRAKIKPVASIEKQRQTLADDYDEFQRVNSSDELKAFLELKQRVNSDKFQQKKKEIESLRFKGSEEDKQIKEFQKLKKTARIRKYFVVKDSSGLVKYEKEKDSDRMKAYYEHWDYVKEGQFENDKKEIKSQVFNGSVEEKHLKDFRRLDKSAAIKAFLELDGSDKLRKHKVLEEAEKFKTFIQYKNAPDIDKEKKKEFRALKRDADIRSYFRFEKSKKLKLYHETVGSHDLNRYYELKEYVRTEEFKKREAFLKDKKKFEKSDAFKKQAEFKKLSADSNVKFVLRYGKSGLYKNYLDVQDSFDLKRYLELEELIGSQEFKERKKWLEDKKRWQKTEEYKEEQRLLEEQERPEFVRYFKYKDSNDFDFLKEWELVFKEEFKGNEIDRTKWGTCSPVAEKLLGINYAMPGDLNLFTNGENLVTGGKLKICVKHEKATGQVWQMPAGFVPTEFEYTSGMLTSGDKFRMEDGILEAKIKYNPVKQVASAFYLSGKENMPRVNLVEMGTKNNLGFSSLNGNGKILSTGLDISNLKKGDYIFSLEKQGPTFTWKINEIEVWQESSNELNSPLQLNVSSLVTDKVPGSKMPVSFEVEWVKCYRKK